MWAPKGPGWPEFVPETWDDAVRICRYLNEDGLSLAAEPKDIWRLPTVEEAVKSQLRHEKNAGGIWDSTLNRVCL